MALILTRLPPPSLSTLLARLQKADSVTFNSIVKELPKAYKLNELAMKISQEIKSNNNPGLKLSNQLVEVTKIEGSKEALPFRENFFIKFEDEL